MNCCVAPLAMDGFAGVTAIDCSVAGVTVKLDVAASEPVCTVTTRSPAAAAGPILNCAVALVGLFTVTGPAAPPRPPPTEIPGPKLACVLP